jgi:hypothetical protein
MVKFNSFAISSFVINKFMVRQKTYFSNYMMNSGSRERDQTCVAQNGSYLRKKGNKPVRKEEDLVSKLLDTFHGDFTTYN